jgi:hypothetical protein
MLSLYVRAPLCCGATLLSGCHCLCAGPCLQFKAVFDAQDAHRSPLPARWESRSLTMLQRMCLLRCLRPDKITLAVQVRALLVVRAARAHTDVVFVGLCG